MIVLCSYLLAFPCCQTDTLIHLHIHAHIHAPVHHHRLFMVSTMMNTL